MPACQPAIHSSSTWVLQARLRDKERNERAAKEAATRKGLIGSGDRSDRIRTYNFPQGRLTDHRINLTLYKLGAVMDGDLGDVVAALQAAQAGNQLLALQARAPVEMGRAHADGGRERDQDAEDDQEDSARGEAPGTRRGLVQGPSVSLSSQKRARPWVRIRYYSELCRISRRSVPSISAAPTT